MNRSTAVPTESRISPDVPTPDSPDVGKTPYRRIYVIANPAAGQDKPILGVLNNAFNAARIDWEFKLTKQAGDAFDLAREGATAGVDVVAVYGGDGTVMEVANGLRGTNVPLAIFPGGTANVMAMALGIPSDLAEATALICGADGYQRSVDMGRVGERHFLLRVGIGLEADMMNKADRDQKERMGRFAYVLSALQALQARTVARYRVTVDGVTHEAEGITCMIANSANLGVTGVNLAATIDVSDGLLDVVVVRDADLGSLVQVAASAAGLGDPLQHWQGREITVEADPPLPVICDGEPIDDTPVRASIVPNAIRVIVPKANVPADALAGGT